MFSMVGPDATRPFNINDLVKDKKKQTTQPATIAGGGNLISTPWMPPAPGGSGPPGDIQREANKYGKTKVQHSRPRE